MNIMPVSREVVFNAKKRVIELQAMIDSVNLEKAYKIELWNAKREVARLEVESMEALNEIYPPMTDADFGLEHALIDEASKELNSLKMFLETRNYPLSGMCDIDHLKGTALEP